MTITRRNLFKLAGATVALAPLVGTAVLAKPSPFDPDEKVFYLSELQNDFSKNLKHSYDINGIVGKARAWVAYIRNLTSRERIEGNRIVLVIDNAMNRHGGTFDTSFIVTYAFHKVILIEPDTKRWKVVKDNRTIAPYYV